MKEIKKSDARGTYRAFLNGGCLNYEDEKGAYKIPLGRRSRRRLLTLEEKPGQYIRSLEIDLLTGFVYYCVDNSTPGGFAYYYDMNSTKVWNSRILRLLRSIRDERFRPSPELKAAVSRLPSEHWEEILSSLPGWEEILAHRTDNLFLPHEPVRQVSVSLAAVRKAGEENPLAGIAGFTLHSEAEPLIRGGQEDRFTLETEADRWMLLYENSQIGGEFFSADEKYRRNLTPAEETWLLSRLRQTAGTVENTDTLARSDAGIQIRHRDGTSVWYPAQEEALQLLRDQIMGYLRRELEIVAR